MNHRQRAALALVAATALATTACGPTTSDESATGSSSTGPTAVSCPLVHTSTDLLSAGVIVGNRANTQRAGGAAIACYLDPVFAHDGAHVIVATDDGHPSAVLDIRTPTGAKGREHRAVRRRLAASIANAERAPADDPQADIIEATALVARGLRADSGPHRIIIDDSMLQTTGVLPMQEGYLFADATDVVEQIRTDLHASIGDLSGFQVILIAPGAGAPPQPQVSEQNRRRLVALWTAIFTDLGASVVTSPMVAYETPAAPAGGFPDVTPVPMQAASPPPVPGSAATPSTKRPASTSPSSSRCAETRLDERQIAFQPDTAQFINPKEAQRVIDAVAKRIKACPGHITLIGTTSSAGTEAGRHRVSTARAQAVRAVLADRLGVSVSSLTAKGVGMHFVGYVNDRRPDGTLDARAAAKNRLVIIRVG